MNAVHFGAGNIGRGFIGEILAKNGFHITFVDVNETIIQALKERKSYTIELADASHQQINVENVTGLNNMTEPEKAVEAIARQPEAESKISKNLLLGCALAEATAIYGFVIGLLIIIMLG